MNADPPGGQGPFVSTPARTTPLTGHCAPVPSLPAVPFVSVVLPVRNEARFIAQTLRQLLEQEYPADRFELLVCDGGSDDATREIVQGLSAAHPQVRLLDNPGQRSSAGRNVGFRAALGDLVVVVDGHVRIPDRRLFANLVDAFRRSGADCLGRPQPLVAAEPGGWAESIALARASRLGHSGSSFIYSGYEGFAPAASMGAAYRPHVFAIVGFVDETLDACEDLDFNTRIDEAGLRCFTSPRLTVEYFARETPRALFQQMFRYGFGRYSYLRRHPARWSAGQLLPPLLVAGLSALPLLALASRPLFALGACLALLYLAVLTTASLLLATRTGWRHLARYVVVFFLVHAGVGCGFWASVFRGGQLARGAT